jgi:hypothetical protein
MKLSRFNDQINHQVGILFSRLFYSLNTKLKEAGLKDHQIESFTIFDSVRADIERELVKLSLTTPYHKDAFDNTDLLHFDPMDINIIRDKIYDKYKFMCSHTTEFFARDCSFTGELMNEGWLTVNDLYISTEEELISWLRREVQEPEIDNELTNDELREKYYENGTFFYTEWNHCTDIMFAKFEGNAYRINH